MEASDGEEIIVMNLSFLVRFLLSWGGYYIALAEICSAIK